MSYSFHLSSSIRSISACNGFKLSTISLICHGPAREINSRRRGWERALAAHLQLARSIRRRAYPKGNLSDGTAVLTTRVDGRRAGVGATAGARGGDEGGCGRREGGGGVSGCGSRDRAGTRVRSRLQAAASAGDSLRALLVRVCCYDISGAISVPMGRRSRKHHELAWYYVFISGVCDVIYIKLILLTASLDTPCKSSSLCFHIA